jgi:Ca-activated chloride channel family protein
LKKIASETGGHFFTATDNKMFAEIFKKIDLMEKSKIETKDFSSKKELYHELLKAGIILLIIGIFLEKIIFIRIP